MATVAVYNTEGKEVEKLEISDNIFGVEINENLMHKAVVAYLANRRQGTQSALTRSEVRGGGRKPWRQKGTGHARQGSIRAPQWTGGGVVFAPKPRDYSKKLNKRERQIALFSALTSKVNDEKFVVVDEISFDAPKTKTTVEMLDKLDSAKALIITKDKNENLVLSARNIPGVDTTISTSINVYDILNHDALVITKDAVKAIEEVYA
ncbi:MAG: 50S ribosomal protein L4 [Eubacterium sp.]|nr:50S ribosomal protein L4 [Eubacterium sp.]